MTIQTMTLIIMFFGLLAIASILLAAYFAAAWKDEKRKNIKRKKR